MAKGKGSRKKSKVGADQDARQPSPEPAATPDGQPDETQAPTPAQLSPLEQLQIAPENAEHPSALTVLAAFERFKTGDYATTRARLAPILAEGSGAPEDVLRAAGFISKAMGFDPMTMAFAAMAAVAFGVVVFLAY